MLWILWLSLLAVSDFVLWIVFAAFPSTGGSRFVRRLFIVILALFGLMLATMSDIWAR